MFLGVPLLEAAFIYMLRTKKQNAEEVIATLLLAHPLFSSVMTRAGGKLSSVSLKKSPTCKIVKCAIYILRIIRLFLPFFISSFRFPQPLTTHRVAIADFWRTFFITMEKSALAGEGGGAKSPPLTLHSYHHVQSCSVRSS